MTKIFYILLALLLLLSLVEIGASLHATKDNQAGLWALTRTLLGLCGCLYLYRRCPALALGVALGLLMLEAYQVGAVLGGLVAPGDPSYLMAA